MNIPEWANLFWQQIKETDVIQWIEVLLAKANKIWLYPTGIAGILLSAFILFESGLYAECLLNGYYLVMSAYGWWYWIKKRNQPPIKITYSTRKAWWIVIGIVIIGF